MSDDLSGNLGAPATPASNAHVGRSQMIASRYVNGYKSSSSLVSLGDIVKIIGYVLGGLVVLGGFIALIVAAIHDSPGSGIGIFLLCLLYAVLIVFGTFVYGSVIAAIGHLVSAAQDVAVNTSPLIGDDERASILTLN